MSFLEKELRVMYALGRWPKASMRSVSDALGMSLSTVSSIKSSLIKAGHIRPTMVALPKVIGMNFRGVDAGPIMPGKSSRGVLDILERASSENAVTYKAMMDGANYHVQALSKDMGSMRSFLHGLDPISGVDFNENDQGRLRLILDLDDEIMHNIGDHSGIIRNAFGISVRPVEGMERENPGPFGEIGTDTIGQQCRRALPYFLGCPIKKDQDLEGPLSLSKQRIGKLRNELERRKLIVRNNLIDFRSLGMDTTALIYIEYKKDRSPGELTDFESLLRSEYDPFFWARNGYLSTFEYWFKSLSDMKLFRSNLLSLFEDSPIQRLRVFFLSGDITNSVRYLDEKPKDGVDEGALGGV